MALCSLSPLFDPYPYPSLNSYLATDMSRKRSVSDMSEYGPEVKKQKRLPHRGKIRTVMDDFVDLLSPAAPESLKEFNTVERAEGRRGATPLDFFRLWTEFNRLLRITNIETLDAKLSNIDLYLAKYQTVYDLYIHNAAVKGKAVHSVVELTLGNVIWRINEAREQLSSMLPHWMCCWGKAKHYHPRHQRYST
jgi:hypothetical protein